MEHDILTTEIIFNVSEDSTSYFVQDFARCFLSEGKYIDSESIDRNTKSNRGGGMIFGLGGSLDFFVSFCWEKTIC